MNETYHQKLRAMGISLDDAVQLSRELLERCPRGKKGANLLNYCRDIICHGSRVVQEARRSVSLRQAIEISLQEREDRRPRTLYELHYFRRRILESCTRIADMELRCITAQHCYDTLTYICGTPRQYCKDRVLLHSIFACGMRHGWCNANPVKALHKPRLRETEVISLSWENIKGLLHTAKLPPFRRCMPPLGIMLWAGVRPTEMQRLHWEDINWEDEVIMIRPKHSKTGGARCTTLHPVLRRWLVNLCCGERLSGPICPSGWKKLWYSLRSEAGVLPWQQDVLRHTFASYHLKHFRDLSLLQIEMGHSTPYLLRTRYLNMRGITREHARQFWSPKEWC